MNRRNKFISILLVVAFVVTQFTVLPWLVSAEEPAETTRIPEEILNEAKEKRTPIIWFDFEDVKPGDSTVKDKVSGIVATYGEQKKEDEKPVQHVTTIPVTDSLTLNGKAFQPTGNRDLIMPYEPLSQTEDEVTIQAWVRMAEVRDWDNLFWATSIKGHTKDIQQSNFIGVQPKRGDTEAFSLIVADKAKGGDGGATKVAAEKGVSPKVGEWSLLTITQKGTEAILYINEQEVGRGNIHYPMSQLYDKIKATDSSLTMNDVKMGIGTFTNDWWDDTLHGLVDDFRIYNVALTADEIKAEYDSMADKLAAMPKLAFNVQQVGGHSAHLPNLTRTAPASRDWGEFVWGHWHDIKGDLYLKTFVKVTKVPGKEDSDKPVAYFDYQMDGQSKGQFPMPAVKEFEDGIWKSIVVPAKVELDGRKEFRFQNRNRDDIYNIFVGPVFAIDTNDTPLELPAHLKAENEAYKDKINSFPNYKPVSFDEERDLHYKMDGLHHDNMSHNDRCYVTVTPNGNYLTTRRDLHDHLTWNGYPDRFGRKDGLPAGKYNIIYAYKAEGKPFAKSTEQGFGKWEWGGLHGFFGSEATLDGKWHVQIDTIDLPEGIAGNAEFRIRNEWHRGDFTLSVGQIFVVPYDDPSISVKKNAFISGEAIEVDYRNINNEISGMKIVNKDDSDIPGASYWIDLPDEGRNVQIPDGTFTYEFNEDGSANKFKILPPGEYKLRLQRKDKSEAMSIEFKVLSKEAPSISIDKGSYKPGESIKVTYKNINDEISGMKIVNKDDSDIPGASYWIDLPDEGRNVQVPDGIFTYEFNEDGSDHKFKILSPGVYKLRLQKKDKSEAMSVEFTIEEPVKPSISLGKTEYEVGESIVVNYKDIDDTISGMKIVNKDDSDIPGASYWIDLPDEGRNVQIPSGTFTYEFNEDGSANKFKILPPGEYKLRLQRKDKSEAMSVEFTIKEAAVEVDEDVQKVIDMINDLTDEITLDDEDAIVAARKAYDELSDEQKAKIEKSILDKLEAAEKALEELKGEDPKDEDPKGEDPKDNDPSPKTGDIIPSAILTLLTGAASLSLYRKKKHLKE